MRAFSLLSCLAAVLTVVVARAQGGVDPAYLRQYYAQIAQTAGERSAAEATPIYEQGNSDNSGQYQQRSQSQQGYSAPSSRQYAQPQQSQPVQYVQQQPGGYKQLQQQQQQGAPKPRPRPQAAAPIPYKNSPQQEADEEEEEYDNPSYQFGFDVKDDEFTNYQNRKEVREGNVIKGSYSVVDSDGFIRTVTYTADPKEGFKAEVVREPTDIVVKVPTQPPQTQKHQPQQHQQQQQQQQHYAQPQQQQYRPAPKQHQQQQSHQQQQPHQQQQYQQY